MAVNCPVAFCTIVTLAGVTAMETNAGGATVSVVEPTTEPNVALMLVVPCANVVANPVLLMLATPDCEDPHVTHVLRLRVLLSL